MQVHELLREASSFLRGCGREPRAAEVLLRHHLGMSRATLFQHMRDECPQGSVQSVWKDVKRHAEGVPVQYLTGEEDFYGRTFLVNRDVLIPRPETEELVAAVLADAEQHFAGNRPLRLIDVGTGSGVIAITLALENPRFHVSAVDVSAKATQVAETNAERLGARVDVYQGDLLTPFIERGARADVIVANPPYISERAFMRLDPLVKNHEPREALYGGADGLDLYRRLVAQLPEAVASPGLVAFEVGAEQSRPVARLLKEVFGAESTVSVREDINGKDRIVTAAAGT